MARTHGHGNPKWTRDETILALDLYFECGGNMPSGKDARVQKLSKLLRSLPYHGAVLRKDSFRNPDGVAFKLQNLRQVATGKGLGNVSEMDRKVWSEFGSQLDKVKQVAGLIRAGVVVAESFEESFDGPDEEEFFEGRVITELHKRRERDQNLRERLLSSRRRTGRLTCDMCRAQSQAGAPTLEDATFEVHHLLPLSMAIERTTRLADVALLCANCHRLLHRAISLRRSWLGVSEGKGVIGLLEKK
jgi:5-methylcytosine-specific restriction protein A